MPVILTSGFTARMRGIGESEILLCIIIGSIIFLQFLSAAAQPEETQCPRLVVAPVKA